MGEISRSKALDTLRLWQRQERTLHCFIYDVAVDGKWKSETSVVVRVKSVSDDGVKFDASSMIDELGANIGFRLILDQEKVAFFLDGANASPDVSPGVK